MGSPPTDPCDKGNETRHQVTLTRDYEIGDTEVTQAEFVARMGYRPSQFAGCGGDCPVEQVTWHEAAAYCNALSVSMGLPTCYACSGAAPDFVCATAATFRDDDPTKTIYRCPGYRLPTEAEWEAAARAGTTTSSYAGDISECPDTQLDAVADAIGWYSRNSGDKTHATGAKQANAYGLHDMNGNVLEWTHDAFVGNLGTADVVDPITAVGSSHTIRGGAWGFSAATLRSAYRDGYAPAQRANNLGFRPARSR